MGRKIDTKLGREDWKVIFTAPDYAVSNHGRVKSLRYGKLLKPRTVGHAGRQYMQVALRVDKEPVYRYVHRLVAHEFVPMPDFAYSVRHIDGDARNNHFKNLEWVSFL